MTLHVCIPVGILPCCFFAQVEPTVGLFGLIIQGGSFGLLAYLIIFGLPAQQKAIATERKDDRSVADGHLDNSRKDFTESLGSVVAEQKSQRIEYTATMKEISTAFKNESAAERAACEKHFSTLADAMRSGNETTMAATRATAEQLQRHAMQNEQYLKMLMKRAEEEGMVQRTETMQVDNMNIKKVDGGKS